MRGGYVTAVPVQSEAASKLARELVAELIRDHYPIVLQSVHITEYRDAVTVVATLPNGGPVSRHEYLLDDGEVF